MTRQLSVGTNGDIDLIAIIQKLKGGLQEMITVGPATNDVQKQVKLGRGRPVPACYDMVFQPSTTILS